MYSCQVWRSQIKPFEHRYSSFDTTWSSKTQSVHLWKPASSNSQSVFQVWRSSDQTVGSRWSSHQSLSPFNRRVSRAGTRLCSTKYVGPSVLFLLGVFHVSHSTSGWSSVHIMITRIHSELDVFINSWIFGASPTSPPADVHEEFN